MAVIEEEKQPEFRLYSGQYLGEISALCFLHVPSHLSSLPYLLAGSGSQVLVYDLQSRTKISLFQVFEGIRVHGIACSLIECGEESSTSSLSYTFVVYGEKRVKVFTLNFELASGSERGPEGGLHLSLLHSLPRFPHWVLDVLFLEGIEGSSDSVGNYLVVGCSNNSVHLWDMSSSTMLLHVQSPDRCLLYCMKLWGNNLKTLQIASGTIYNEVIVWKIVPCGSPPLDCSMKENIHMIDSSSISLENETVHICRLVGHEGSIFRIGWSSDGSRLVSVSDDRSARIWSIPVEQNGLTDRNDSAGAVLFGHSARVWDCCISDNLIVTAGEDCTCRMWGKDGTQLEMIKVHTGRGIWRCLYDPNSSLLITAGFDSAIKVHQVQIHQSGKCKEQVGENNQFKMEAPLTIHLPNSSGQIGLMDSKSEYVRCLHFKCQDILYVATNHGYLYHARLSHAGNVKWTELIHLKEEVPVVCMDIFPGNTYGHSLGSDDWIALGDGKGNLTIVMVTGDINCPEIGSVTTWSSARERQLLGAYWCKSLGFSYVFTSDPRGCLKLWRLFDPRVSDYRYTKRNHEVTLVAEFSSGFGIRIMCLDALSEEELLVCGDLRGGLVLFRLPKDLLLGSIVSAGVKISPISYFKGAHGISSVSGILVARLTCSRIEIRSTGADGCICFFEFDKDQLSIEFIGMKQVKELSLIQSVSADHKDANDLANCKYVAGFASTDFIIRNVVDETKVVQIPCGGWRRPHSYYVGDVPETMNCFAYVKDEIICIHRQWLPESGKMLFPQNLHMQFHGKELHSLCFVYGNPHIEVCGKEGLFDRSNWIATGCEDGSVRLTRFTPELENWSESKLLGEHVGGSSVRSIYFVSTTHILSLDSQSISGWVDGPNNCSQNEDHQCVLVSVGAKRVLTSWLLRNRGPDEKEKTYDRIPFRDVNGFKPSSEQCSSMSCRWLSTDQPTRIVGIQRRDEITDEARNSANLGNCAVQETINPGKGESESKFSVESIDKDDWRYLAVTAFLVQCTGSRLTICFIVVACSDATLTLRALLLPHRLWFDVAVLVPASSPILALQHVVIPIHPSSKENSVCSSMYMVISGATDGSITFWNITESVVAFARRVSSLQVEKFIDCQRRPCTGRGSQGGRSWRTLGTLSKKRYDGVSAAGKAVDEAPNKSLNTSSDCTQVQSRTFLESATDKVKNLAETCEIRPVYVVDNVHQSGVNCLHVSPMECTSCIHGHLFSVVSGGDDQALGFLNFSLSFSADLGSGIITPVMIKPNDKFESIEGSICYSQCQIMKYQIQFFVHRGIASAHSSAIKGIWTDGKWVFSTGLDQRVRCWKIAEHGQLTEHSHVITSVPEPEALDARSCGRSHYQIAVAGRGMQVMEFSADLY